MLEEIKRQMMGYAAVRNQNQRGGQGKKMLTIEEGELEGDKTPTPSGHIALPNTTSAPRSPTAPTSTNTTTTTTNTTTT